MRKLSRVWWLGLWLVVGAVGTAADRPAQQDILLATAQVERGGAEYPLVARKDGKYYQVFVVKGRTNLYFSDKDGVSHNVVGRDTSYPLFYYKDKKWVAFKLPEKREGVTLASGSESGEAAVKRLGETAGKDKVYRVYWCNDYYFYGFYNVGAYYYPPFYLDYCYNPCFAPQFVYADPCFYGPRVTFYAWGC